MVYKKNRNRKRDESMKKETSIKVEKKAEPVIYIGPTIPNIINENTIYNNGIPKILEEEIRQCPILNSLIVPISKLAQKKQEIQNKESTFVLYEKVNQYVQKKGGVE